jgi:hypothetical protein
MSAEFFTWDRDQLLDVSLSNGDRFLGFLTKQAEDYAEFLLPERNIGPQGGFRLLGKESIVRVRLNAVEVIKEHNPADLTGGFFGSSGE